MRYTKENHTFVICAYKESRYLEDCIISLTQQTIESKIIISTSTPNTHIKKLAEKYKIELFVREGKSGLAEDWNFAVSCVKTELFTLCHQDDYYIKTYAETILQSANKSRNPLIIYTGYGEEKKGQIITKNINLTIKKILNFPLTFQRNWKSQWLRRRILSFGNPICCPAVSFNTLLMQGELFDSKFKNAVDWDMWERLSKREGEFIYCPRVLMIHRVHQESTTTKNIADNTRGKEDIIIFKRFWPTFIARGIAKIFSLSEKGNV